MAGAVVTLVQREDLSKRTYLSKSALNTFALCQRKAFYEIHDRRPLIPNERVTFGSAVDAGTEQIATFLRSGQPVQMERVVAAAEEVIARDDVGVDITEVERACERFVTDVAVHYDWSLARTQASLLEVFEDLGEVGGHPDLIFKGNRVRDVKTAQRAKPEEPTVELGLYALLVEAETGEAVPDVGYLTWVRTQRPYWQIVEFPVTDELRRWTREMAAGYVRATKADAFLNAKKRDHPLPYSFPGGPAFRSMCGDCQYAPANGGSCELAYRETAA